MVKNDKFIGKHIGNYRIVEEIASGSFGCVYKGVHLFLTRRVVAIKILHRTFLGSQRDRDNFLQEAQLLEMLKHPHILPIYDVGIQDGIPYVVTEYAPNGSLRDLLQQYHPHPLQVDEALTILMQIGQALHHAHQGNIIHRDLKPENILFNAKGEALLADFGIAVVLETPQTSPVNIIGSPLYMAPEQFDGMVSQRSDQYALACIGYEMLTTHNPFGGQNAFTMALKHKMADPLAPSHFNPELPLPLERAILKGMSRERSDRYSDILTFIAALHTSSVQKTKEEWLAEGNRLHELERYQQALQAFDRATQLDVHFAEAHSARGDALVCLNRPHEALLAYERAIQCDPTYAHAYEGKANLLYNLKHYAEALTMYEKAITLDQTSASAYNGKGDALYYLNHYREALLAYERAIQCEPSSATAHDGKSWTLWQLNRYEEALLAAEQALRLDPGLASAYNGKADALYSLKHYEEALLVYEQAILCDPYLFYAYAGKGKTLCKLKHPTEALIAFDHALTLNSHYAPTYDGKGWALYDLRHYREALAAYEQALRLTPHYAKAYSNKGVTLYSLTRYEEALTAHEQAILLQPNKAIFHFHRSRALRQLGRLEEAQQAYERARQLGYTG